jgi:hypothetical protein
VRVALPGARGPVIARVARVQSGFIAMTFRQDQATLLLLDYALDTIAQRAALNAA